MKLFTIGDSVSQGFMSFAGARTDLSFSSILAGCMGERAPRYRYPSWPAGGMPANLEGILRALEARYGSDIKGLEWLTVLHTLNNALDLTEDYYERGSGSERRPYDDSTSSFHNVAVWGFKVADAWGVTPKVCHRAIDVARQAGGDRDALLGVPSAAMYRTALAVLNPSRAKEHDDKTQLGWLAEHQKNEGIENLVLFLGANNALGTLIELRIKLTPGDGQVLTASHEERAHAGWNLWHPKDFKSEFLELIRRVDEILDTAPTKVFVGTIPLITICPLAKGVGATTTVDTEVLYKYYTYFPFDEEFVQAGGPALTMQDAQFIDRCIRQYNTDIREIIAASNLKHPDRYHIVDVCKALSDLAWKRNGGKPIYQFPDAFQWLYPPVNTKYYHADATGRIVQGGIFSLDGVHPTAIGQGLLAEEWRTVMMAAGVSVSPIDWDAIFVSDELHRHPIRLMQEIYQHEKLSEWVVKVLRAWRG